MIVNEAIFCYNLESITYHAVKEQMMLHHNADSEEVHHGGIRVSPEGWFGRYLLSHPRKWRTLQAITGVRWLVGERAGHDE